MRPLVQVLRMWPVRRWVGAAVLTGPLAAGYAAVTEPGSGTWGAVGVAVASCLAALVLASYLPAAGSGRWLEVGCSPCAIVAAGTVVGSFVLRANVVDGAGTLGLALLMFGLAQRLTDARSCSLPASWAG